MITNDRIKQRLQLVEGGIKSDFAGIPNFSASVFYDFIMSQTEICRVRSRTAGRTVFTS